MADWTCSSNDALHLSFVRTKADKEILDPSEDYQDFHPTFTYPIFGEEEQIYGYKNLSIQLKFASGSLAQYLSVTHSAKLKATGSTVDDVEGTLFKFIPPDYTKKEDDFLERVERDAKEFRPFGAKIHTYTRTLQSDDPSSSSQEPIEFEVYHATWDTPGFKEYHRRMQIFILLYIEAGTYIQEDEDAWEFVTLYEKRRRPDGTDVFHFAGYSTLFRFFHFPDKIRLRLSQFVIVGPYQRNGHGSALYNAIYQYVVSQPHIAELTVEDPAEAFEDLRDKTDLRNLIANEKFMEEAFGVGWDDVATVKGKGKLGPPADKAWVQQWRKDLKMAGRQFQRLMEMLTLHYTDQSDERAMRAYRLQVKERIYRFNFDALAQLEKEEKLQKLEETFQSVKEGYLQILGTVY